MRSAIDDRFEGSYPVVEIDGMTTNIERGLISPEAKEGDVLIMVDNKWQVDKEATAKLQQAVKDMADEVWQ